jgi:hypothetical protein
VLFGEFLMVKANVPETASKAAKVLDAAILAKAMGVPGLPRAPASRLYRGVFRLSAHDGAFGWCPARRCEMPRPDIISPLSSHRIAEVKSSSACFPSP